MKISDAKIVFSGVKSTYFVRGKDGCLFEEAKAVFKMKETPRFTPISKQARHQRTAETLIFQLSAMWFFPAAKTK